jgi:hypothetical protein
MLRERHSAMEIFQKYMNMVIPQCRYSEMIQEQAGQAGWRN